MMRQQITDTVLMIRPVNFRMNEQTAVNNYYQKVLEGLSPQTVQDRALKEFDAFVDKLRAATIRVIVVEDSREPDTPDSIFPNNWISFHEENTVALYPMFAENRRLERREEVLEAVEKEGFLIAEVVDYTEAETDGLFLEGTGSMILDRVNRKAYCALSPRADEELFIEFCEDFEYTPVLFTAWQTVNGTRKPIYHTNVMMSVGEDFAVVCTAAIDDKKERKQLVSHLKEDGKEIIEITEDQVNSFAGNMLQLKGGNGSRYLVMSEAARQSLDREQLEKIGRYCEILSAPLDVIEACGGGSARCMMAEIFLRKGQG
ncbi:citrulline utilization hydrolase CtlX [Sinomicrobium soli]|uniref:citrulline utilization hydrolase CtlX n=1 Tax=Sinomicrobium sp. N-1-3-6 TaxID=2219864 RepID=UPI001F1ABD9F|nr:arginine deiminase-related protein [Sinomicrobium sp. N-1-3-6]